jgi:hypothetical protein
VQVSRDTQKLGECDVRVSVEPDPNTRGPGDLVAFAFLFPKGKESNDYGLYSYLLFGARPHEKSAAVYRSVVVEYLRTMPEIGRFVQVLEKGDSSLRKQINVSYLPLKRFKKSKDTVAAVLANYDYERAKKILSRLPGTHRAGPYLVSSRTPLTDQAATARGYMVHDISRVEPSKVPLYVETFLNQAAQERFGAQWNPQLWVLELRTLFVAVGLGAQAVSKAIGEWKSTVQQ